jgi:hypothetical protein
MRYADVRRVLQDIDKEIARWEAIRIKATSRSGRDRAQRRRDRWARAREVFYRVFVAMMTEDGEVVLPADDVHAVIVDGHGAHTARGVVAVVVRTYWNELKLAIPYARFVSQAKAERAARKLNKEINHEQVPGRNPGVGENARGSRV